MKNSDGRQVLPGTLRLTGIKLMQGALSNRLIAKQVGLAETTVRKIKRRLAELGMVNPQEFNSLPDQELLRLFYPDQYEVKPRVSSVEKLTPDYKALAHRIQDEHCKPDSLYNAYIKEAEAKELCPFSKSYFKCRLRETFEEECGINPETYLAQVHPYGRDLQLDFSGDTVKVLTHNGPVKCWVMVLCWPASYYGYVEFVTGQTTSESCRVIGNAIYAFGMHVPAVVQVDNARCFVTFHRGSEAIINRNFADFMMHMGVCIDAAPPYHPQFYPERQVI